MCYEGRIRVLRTQLGDNLVGKKNWFGSTGHRMDGRTDGMTDEGMDGWEDAWDGMNHGEIEVWMY